MTSTFERSRSRIEATFQALGRHVFSEWELRSVFRTHKTEWKLAKSASEKDFVSATEDLLGFRRVELRGEDYASKQRFVRGQASPLEVALSLRTGSYLSHASAVFLHGLNDQLPKSVYVNREQSVKPKSKGELTQAGLNRAFGNRQRISEYVFGYESHRIVVLSGKNTGDLGVIEKVGRNGELLRVTNLERTLIDIVVRPAYGGGVVQVLEAYRGALGRASSTRMLMMLKKLDFVYPFHQAIGFLMQRAGFPRKDVEKFKRLGLRFDFFLTHGLKNPSFDETWRLFVPKGF